MPVSAAPPASQPGKLDRENRKTTASHADCIRARFIYRPDPAVIAIFDSGAEMVRIAAIGDRREVSVADDRFRRVRLSVSRKDLFRGPRTAN